MEKTEITKHDLIKIASELIDLRNRLSNDSEDEIIYEEDHLLLDQILDVLELKIKEGE